MSRNAEALGYMPGTVEERRRPMAMTEAPPSVGTIAAALGRALEPQPTPGGVCIPLPIESFGEPQGSVRGAVESNRKAEMPQSAWLLPAGQAMRLDEGTAIAVLSKLKGQKSDWIACEMPAGGEIIGPLVWGWKEPAPEKAVTRRRATVEAKKSAEAMSYWVFGICATLTTLLTFRNTDGWGEFVVNAIAFALAGAIVACAFEIVAPSVLIRRDRRRISDFAPLRALSVPLPSGVKSILSPDQEIGTLPKPGADFSDVQTHDEVRSALQQLSKTWERHEANDAREPRSQGSRAARARLNHTVGTIAQIAGQIAEHSAVAEREEVRLPFLQLIADAEDSLRRFEMDCDDQRSREVLASIRALATQLEGSGSVPSKPADKSTQS